jgi:hypothetical protein
MAVPSGGYATCWFLPEVDSVTEPPQKEFVDQDQLERFSVKQEHNQHTKAHNTIYDVK